MTIDDITFVSWPIHYESIAEEATKRDIWVKAPGGNHYADLSSLDPPREGILVQLGFCYTIIDVDDLDLLSKNMYWFDGKYVSSRWVDWVDGTCVFSSVTHLHHDIMMRILDPEDRIISCEFYAVHRDKNIFNNRRSNLQLVEGRFVLDFE